MMRRISQWKVMNGPLFYYFKLPNIEPPENITKITKFKFHKKFFLWLAISGREVSDPVFFKGGL